jgi:hypothetical protein
VVDVAEQVRRAVAGDQWARVRLLLHPYLRWELPDGTELRGRVRVLELLHATGPPDPPRTVELRDGQVYRWLQDDRAGGGRHAASPTIDA